MMVKKTFIDNFLYPISMKDPLKDTMANNLRRLVGALTLCLFTLGGNPASFAQSTASDANWSVLEYDEQGNVTNIITREGDDQASDSEILEMLENPANTPQSTPQNTRDTIAIPSHSNEFKKEFLDNEVVIVGLDSGALNGIIADGFYLLERVYMRSLNIEISRLRIPPEMSVPKAVLTLRKKYPKLIIDSHDVFEKSSDNIEGLIPPPVRNKKLFGNNYAREIIGWPRVGPTCGRGLRIGMIDGDVNTTHAQLVDRDVTFRNFVRDKTKPIGEKHGTAIATLLVGRNSEQTLGGLFPGASLFAAGVFQNRNQRDVVSLTAMLAAINWMAEENIKVVNIAVTGNQNQLMQLFINKAIERGMVLVAAAGNNGPTAQPVWPAANSNVVAVTAIDHTLNIYKNANQGDYIDFAAPGVNILTNTTTGLIRQTGTSFSTPYVTAAVALLIQVGFEANADIMRKNLHQYVVDLGNSGKDQIFGAGLIKIRPNCAT